MNLLARKNRPGDNHLIEIAEFFQSFTIIINRAQSVLSHYSSKADAKVSHLCIHIASGD